MEAARSESQGIVAPDHSSYWN
ncbi:Protein of unknown function [Bacillus wiedmannii]|uniref:Uncharacterized protein n=1 Tax=Bacillus wiedmannii TaxID=1890302 RepID=A0AB37Z109_9BACI|nr:Protein of unknown function [Bacillus wiedmannii]